MTSAHRRAARSHDSTAWTVAVPHVEDRFPLRSSRLHDHLLRDHGRTAGEITGLPLVDLHHFEHVEQAMGLTDLSHRHPADRETHPRVSTDAEEGRSPEFWVTQTAGSRGE
jgi:hypothetical protein